MTHAEMVEEFMVTYGQLPNMMGLGEAVALGRRLVEEELDEKDDALALKDEVLTKIELFDAGLDTLYFAYGNMLREGFTVKQILDGAKNNLSKIRYIYLKYSDKEAHGAKTNLHTTLSCLNDFELVQIYESNVLLKNKLLY